MHSLLLGYENHIYIRIHIYVYIRSILQIFIVYVFYILVSCFCFMKLILCLSKVYCVFYNIYCTFSLCDLLFLNFIHYSFWYIWSFTFLCKWKTLLLLIMYWTLFLLILVSTICLITLIILLEAYNITNNII